MVLYAIERAREQILVDAYELTSRPIAEALIEAKNKGVKVFVVCDGKENRKRYSVAGILSRNGIPVRLDDRFQIMHNKTLVIDNKSVETGSFNFTKQASSDRNAENAILFEDVPGLAASYAQYWAKRWAESSPY